MEDFLRSYLNEQTSWLLLLPVIVVSLGVLGKSADWLVRSAVALSLRSGLPKVVIGATVVSLGTTSPETAVSVVAALQGSPGLALGNAVGSIICDTGLILGLAAVVAPLPLDRLLVNRQGWLQVAAGCLLVLACWPITAPLSAFSAGGSLPRSVGVIFLLLLLGYLWLSVRWARERRAEALAGDDAADGRQASGIWIHVASLVMALLLVVGSSWVLIPAVEAAARKLGVPESIISATLVAFGTSLPELVTAVTAARQGHGELAIGNIIGADILNVLFVAGASAAVTSGGLAAEAHFYYLLFPIMLTALGVLRIAIHRSGDALGRRAGVALLTVYGIYLLLGVALGVTAGG